MTTIDLDRFRDVDLVIDKANDNFIAKQWTSVGDKNGRTLTVMITNEGAVGELVGATVSLLWTNKANGLTDETAFTVKDKDTSAFVIEYPGNMLTAGTVVAQIRVWYEGKVVATKPFEIEVGGIAGQMAGVVKQQEFGLLTAVLADANRIKTDIDSLDNKKADKTALSATDIKVAQLQTNKVDKGGNEQVTMPMLSQQVKEAMTGGSVAVVGEGAVNISNIAPRAVTPSKTSFIKRGKNLFDYNTSTDGIFPYYQTGIYQNNVYYATSDYIDIVNGVTQYTINNPVSSDIHVVLRDSKGVYLQGYLATNGSTTFSISSSTAYIELGYPLTAKNQIQLETGTQSTEYESFEELLIGDYLPKNIIRSDNLEENNIAILTPSINLYNKDAVQDGVFRNYQTGAVQSNANYSMSSPIEFPTDADSLTFYPSGASHIVYLNANNQRIGGVAPTTEVFTIKKSEIPNIAKIVISIQTGNKNIAILNVGEERLPYVPFGKGLEKDKLSYEVNQQLNKIESLYPNFEILVPSVIHLTVGESFSLYYYNILKNANSFLKGNYSIRCQRTPGSGWLQVGEGYDYKWEYTPQQVETFWLYIRLFDDTSNTMITQKQVRVIVSNPNADVKNIVTIGDSFTADYGLVLYASQLLTSRGNNVNFLGTKDTSSPSVKHEAVSGWSYASYFANNPQNKFYNQSSQTFDFNYYMQNNFPGQSIDCFMILLGINDITRNSTDANLSTIKSQLNSMIDSVNDYDSNIKILVHLIPPQAYSNTYWENTYGNNFMRAGRMKYMQEKFNEMIISEFDTDDFKARNVHVMPTHATLDVRYGINTQVKHPVKFADEIEEVVTYDTHPNIIGSKQISDGICNSINGYLL